MCGLLRRRYQARRAIPRIAAAATHGTVAATTTFGSGLDAEPEASLVEEKRGGGVRVSEAPEAKEDGALDVFGPSSPYSLEEVALSVSK